MRLALIACMMTATAAQADGLLVQFADGAPKDSLVFQNNGCPLRDATIVIDLRGTAAGLIFDVTASGAGVEVFQPVEVETGNVLISPVADGGQVLHLHVPDFASGESIRLTADLDDTTSNRQITVNGSEMVGATVTVAYGAFMQTAPFDSDGLAAVTLPPTADGCLST
ncbi:hypothetical protein SAMN04488515_0535 [Cognatiyoonia koreensis]|uniref:Aggregation factor core n=1 Tax=Cognatiyoonia koreensis TaxID=364200 RepID=A0A1I0NC90_9RHOB|nr:hypothetical protein [Cognatiyoonia koreensis]SEV98848.1 hypothetical protein SAMN04488515_0535 [Cognatiyoonia koreensis]